MIRKFLVVLLLFVWNNAYAQTITGTWSGDLNVQGMKLPLVLHISQNGDSLVTTMDSPSQGANGIPANKTSFAGNELNIEITGIGASYKGKLNADSISGTFTQMSMNLPLTFKKGTIEVKPPNRPQMPKPPFNYNIEEVKFVNPIDTNTLAGTFTIPKDKKQFPVVVMITGSGAQDRDETLFGHKPFWVIADHLTKNGVGVLRLDDRGVDGSSIGKKGATSANFATDIDAAVNFLTKKGYKKIGLIGHSEGGMIAPMVAEKNKNVKFIVSMAGPGINIEELMVKQTYEVVKSAGATDIKAKESAEQNRKLYQFVKAYKGDSLEKDLKKFIQNDIPEPEELKNINPEQKRAMIEQQSKMFTNPWFTYFLRFDPQPYISKLKIPVLAINGNKDVQVYAKDNLAGWEASLKKAGNKNYKIVELEGLNHLFQEAKTGSVGEYSQIEQTISPKVLDLITNWILKLK